VVISLIDRFGPRLQSHANGVEVLSRLEHYGF
jgi:hypothetical protein